MQFIYPLFLGALALLAIPVIIHLFYFRRYKKVWFTNVQFLKEIKEESSIRSRLKNLLTLLARLLAIIFLVLGFAQPFLKKEKEVKAGKKYVSIFIDNSYSMASLSQDAPLLDEAKKKAEEIISAYELEDQFQIISHDVSARQQRFIGKDQAISLVDDLELTPEANTLSKIRQRQKQLLDPEDSPNKILYYLSDFQANITDLDIDEADTLYEYNFIPLQAVVERNVSIDSAWFEAPVQMMNTPNKLLVKVQNWSNEKVENIQLSIKKDGSVKPVGSLDIEGGTYIVDTVFITTQTPGFQEIELKITDFPIQFDDSYFLSFPVKQQIETLIVNGTVPNRYLDAAFEIEQYFNKAEQPVSNLNYTSFNQYQLIVLNEVGVITSGLSSALKTYIEGGGNVLVFPPARTADLSSYNVFMSSLNAGRLQQWDTISRLVNYVNLDEFIFSDVFEKLRGNLRLPACNGNYHLSNQSRGFEKLMGFRDGKTYLGKYQREKGHLYFCTAPLNQSFNNLVTQAEVFIPMLYKMALSTAVSRKVAYTIGSDNFVELENASSGAEVVYKVEGAASFIPGQQSFGKEIILNMHDQVQIPGIYRVYLEEGQPLISLGFNSNRMESDPTCFSSDQLADRYGDQINLVGKTQLANLADYIKEKDQGVLLWKYCLILALIFLALETLIIRFWKV